MPLRCAVVTLTPIYAQLQERRLGAEGSCSPAEPEALPDHHRPGKHHFPDGDQPPSSTWAVEARAQGWSWFTTADPGVQAAMQTIWHAQAMLVTHRRRASCPDDLPSPEGHEQHATRHLWLHPSVIHSRQQTTSPSNAPQLPHPSANTPAARHTHPDQLRTTV